MFCILIQNNQRMGEGYFDEITQELKEMGWKKYEEAVVDIAYIENNQIIKTGCILKSNYKNGQGYLKLKEVVKTPISIFEKWEIEKIEIKKTVVNIAYKVITKTKDEINKIEDIGYDKYIQSICRRIKNCGFQYRFSEDERKSILTEYLEWVAEEKPKNDKREKRYKELKKDRNVDFTKLKFLPELTIYNHVINNDYNRSLKYVEDQ